MSICPGCRQSWEKESWRESDGPCGDGQFYCTDCLMNNRCGCSKEFLEKQAKAQRRPRMTRGNDRSRS